MKHLPIILCCLLGWQMQAQSTQTSPDGNVKTIIRVSVPNATDEVYIVGNQENLGNWQPDKVKMNKISEYEREISLDLLFPAEFKFTRGAWQSEAIVNKLSGQPNFVLQQKRNHYEYYKIRGWADKIDQISQFSTYSDFSIVTINSDVLNQKRILYVSLPEAYDENREYPVIYVTDANILQHFEIVTQTLRQQANFNTFPPCIIIGIFIDVYNRPNELDRTYGENGKKFKKYIFDEVIPFVDKNYATSPFKTIFGHSDGAEFNHYLMMEKDNPFDAFINISENIGEFKIEHIEAFKEKLINFLKTNKKPVKYFVASGIYDDPYRYPSGMEIEKIVTSFSDSNLTFEHKTYEAWHTDLVGLSVFDAFRFVFTDYQNYNLFKKELNEKNSYEKAKQQFIKRNEKYIIPYEFGDNTTVITYEIVVQTKKSHLIKEFFDYEDAEIQYYNLEGRAMVYYESGNISEALAHLEKIVKTNEESSLKSIIFDKATDFFKVYKSANKPDLAYKHLETMLKNNPHFGNELRFVIAKIGLENGIQIEKSKKYLKQAEKMYTENSIFTREDVEKLKNIK